MYGRDLTSILDLSAEDLARILDVALHEQPRSGNAAPTGRGKEAKGHPMRRVIQVRVGKHDLRRFPAQFHYQGLDLACRNLGHPAPAGDRACEAVSG